MHVVIFEDLRWTGLAPAALSRPVFCLASGMGTLLDKQVRAMKPSRLTLWVRPELVNFCRRHVLPTLKIPVEINVPLDDQPALLVNGRTLCLGQSEIPREPAMAVDGHDLNAAYTVSPGLSPQDLMDRTAKATKLLDLPRMQSLGRVASYLWDLIAWNEESLRHDAAAVAPRGQTKPAGPYHLVNDQAVSLGQNVTLSPGCVLDASGGPVVIADGAAIGANAVVIGPCSIGPGTQISHLALIRGGTSLGARCKIGGEVSNTLFMDCSNKAHDGYVGDSYIGQWVNFGAGAATSNLKNTYGPISVRLGKQPIPTGRRFLGSLVGDHTKFAISTRLMTGSYIGYCCMIAAGGLTPTHVPSFTFLTDQGSRNYERDKAKEMMTSVFKRRQREWEAGDDEMMEYAAKGAAEVER